ncbi:hypothetical protein ABH892_004069 [Paenibacillus sp. RC254]
MDEQGQSLRRLFHGLVTRMSVYCIRGVYTFELEAASHSYQMDIKLKKRSYQDIHRTYDDLVTTMVRKYMHGDAIGTVTNYAKLDTFVLQHEERREVDYGKRRAILAGASRSLGATQSCACQ